MEKAEAGDSMYLQRNTVKTAKEITENERNPGVSSKHRGNC